jgi:arsenite transporter
MTATAQDSSLAPQTQGKLKIFDRYLSVWVFLCMVTGVLLGKLFPTLVKSASNLEFAGS